jgi:hypothetical protein
METCPGTAAGKTLGAFDGEIEVITTRIEIITTRIEIFTQSVTVVSLLHNLKLARQFSYRVD